MHSVVPSKFIVVEIPIWFPISIVDVIELISIALRYDAAITISTTVSVSSMATSNVRLKMVEVSLIKVRWWFVIYTMTKEKKKLKVMSWINNSILTLRFLTCFELKSYKMHGVKSGKFSDSQVTPGIWFCPITPHKPLELSGLISLFPSLVHPLKFHKQDWNSWNGKCEISSYL